jgi:hypothetical protein
MVLGGAGRTQLITIRKTYRISFYVNITFDESIYSSNFYKKGSLSIVEKKEFI